jgi:hypothetical protein
LGISKITIRKVDSPELSVGKIYIIDDKKFNQQTRSVHPLYKGSTRKPTKSKFRKNKIIPSSARKYEQ